MPHIFIEYSANLAPPDRIEHVLDEVHAAVGASPIVPAWSLRTRAIRCDQYRIMDGAPDQAFVSVVARIGPGRSAEEKSTFLELLLDSVENAVSAAAPDRVVAYSAEIQEIDAEFRINRNHIRARAEQEAPSR